MKILQAVLPLALAGAGCVAGPLMPLSDEERARLEAAPPAVLVTVPWKTVRLQEFLYKVLWNETKLTSYSIDGIWDPAPEFEKTVTENLSSRYGVEAKSLRQTLKEGEGDRLAAARERELKESVVEGWAESYLREPARGEFRALRSRGVEYVLEIGLVEILVWRHAFGIYRFQIRMYGRLTRQSDGAVVWLDHGLCSIPIEGMNSFAELEKDDLARMKRHFAEAVRGLCDPGHPFLKDFRPPR